MNISSFFIERPIFATVLAILITVAGVLAMPNLPISEYPEIVPPTVVVSGQYPGASPKTIAPKSSSVMSIPSEFTTAP